tara:strand:- start:2691 stop:2933 length:243 start_codon:yes stop_codon:yes gene_type:complete
MIKRKYNHKNFSAIINWYLCGFKKKKEQLMSVWRVILSVLFPPLAVYDKGCGSILIVLILTLLGWIPGVIAALIILNKGK